MPFDDSSAQLVSQPNQQQSNSQSQSSNSFDENSAQLINQSNQITDAGLSSLPQQTTQEDINELNAPEGQQPQQQQDPLNIADHAALSFIDTPQDQQAYLQKKISLCYS